MKGAALRGLAVVAFLAGLLPATAGLAREPGTPGSEAEYVIAAKDAASALAEWSAISKITLETRPADLAAEATRAIAGRFTATMALETLLQGTRLEIARDDGDVIALQGSGGPPYDDEPMELDTDKWNRLAAVFSAVRGPGVIARIIIAPSWNAQSAMAIKRQGETYRIVTQTIDDQIGSRTDLAAIKPRTCEVELSPALGAKLAEAWVAVVQRRRGRWIGMDSVNFELSAGEGTQERRRYIWNTSGPEGRVLTVAAAAQAYCVKPSLFAAAEIRAAIATLSAAMAPPPGP